MSLSSEFSEFLQRVDLYFRGAGSEVLSRQEAAQKMDSLSRKAVEKYGVMRKRKPLLKRDAKWQQEWLPSAQFVLMDVSLDKVEQPQPAKNKKALESKLKKFDDEPIFIDRNVSGHWRNTKHTKGQKLDTLVLDGKHRVAAARKLGKKTIKAWVGTQAVGHFTNPDSKGYAV